MRRRGLLTAEQKVAERQIAVLERDVQRSPGAVAWQSIVMADQGKDVHDPGVAMTDAW